MSDYIRRRKTKFLMKKKQKKLKIKLKKNNL